MAGTFTVFRKEVRDQFGSKRFLILFGLILLLSSLSAYQGVDFIRANPESGFLSIFSGTRFSYSFVRIMIFFGPLLGLALGFDAINKERASGTLSIILGNPIFRDSIINGKFLAGTTALVTLIAGTIGIMCGVTIPMLGFGPTLEEASRIVSLLSLTILYLVFWLSLGILYSVLAKKTATSILSSIATWLVFSIVVSILASFVANAIVPLPGGAFQIGEAGREIRQSPEFRETMQRRFTVQDNIEKISPTDLYRETALDILGIRRRFGPLGGQGFERVVTLTEALATNWVNIATLAAGLIVCFTVSYMMFLRLEIRPEG